jgi:hypothetical protein
MRLRMNVPAKALRSSAPAAAHPAHIAPVSHRRQLLGRARRPDAAA